MYDLSLYDSNSFICSLEIPIFIYNIYYKKKDLDYIIIMPIEGVTVTKIIEPQQLGVWNDKIIYICHGKMGII